MPNLPLSNIFIDYEYWFYSLRRVHQKPDISKFVQKIKEKYDINEIMVFGDFSKSEIEKERTEIRQVTNRIIDCTTDGFKKNTTDFIMLDEIYRTIFSESKFKEPIPAYILFTGDAHFISVATFLKVTVNKEVGFYGIQGTMSNQIKSIASWYEEVKLPMTLRQIIVKTIIDAEKSRTIIPTFSGVIKYITSSYGVVSTEVKEELITMINQGALSQKLVQSEDDSPIRALYLNAETISRNGELVEFLT